jgi:putative sterol carrier protein
MKMGLMALPTPPEGIGLKDYFESWLPEQMAGLSPLLKENAPDLKFAVGFRAEGDEGGDWSLKIGEGEIKTEQGIADDAALTMILSAKDLMEVISGKRPLMPGMGRRGGGGEGREQKPDKMAKQMTKMADNLKGINGMIEFEIAGQEEGFKARVNFGPLLDEPTVSITIAEEDFKAMQKGDLNPQAAFMGGKIKISGDLSFLMQLAPMAMG